MPSILESKQEGTFYGETRIVTRWKLNDSQTLLSYCCLLVLSAFTI